MYEICFLSYSSFFSDGSLTKLHCMRNKDMKVYELTIEEDSSVENYSMKQSKHWDECIYTTRLKIFRLFLSYAVAKQHSIMGILRVR